MGAKRSAEMVEALRLVLQQGISAAEAARRTGVTKSAISQTPEYRRHRLAQKGADEDATKHS